MERLFGFQFEKQTQAQGDRNLISGQSDGDQTLTLDDLPSLPGRLPPDPDWLRTELREAGVVDDQHGILATQEVLSAISDDALQSLGLSGTVGDAVLEVILLPWGDLVSQGLHAFSVGRAAEPLYVD